MDQYGETTPAQVLPILSNIAIFPALYYTIRNPRVYHLDIFFFVFTYFNSMLLHTCDQQGRYLCPNIARWRELDYVTAQFGPAYIALNLYPFKRVSSRNSWMLIFATIHLILTELQANDWVSLGGFSVLGFALFITYFREFRQDRLFFTFFAAAVGLLFFYFGMQRVYDYTHSVWHFPAMIAYFLILTARKSRLILS